MTSTPNHVDERRLREHVGVLAAEPRSPGSAGRTSAAEYVHRELAQLGYAVRRDAFAAGGMSGLNVIAEPPAPDRPDHPLVILGAHYDAVSGSPGADDNATAVAALIEVARALARDTAALERCAKRLWLVAFDLEEQGCLGSTSLADAIREAGRAVAGMMSLEMLGYTDHRPGSQNLPPALAGRYSDTGDFIGAVANESSEPLLAQVLGQMKRVQGLPVEALVVPGVGEMMPETRLSDHSPFWDRGYRALMVTDTSFYRNPHYHQPTDTIDTIDFAFLTKVTEGIVRAVEDLLAQHGEA